MKYYNIVAVRTITFTIAATSPKAAEKIALQHCEPDGLVNLVSHQDWQLSVKEVNNEQTVGTTHK